MHAVFAQAKWQGAAGEGGRGGGGGAGGWGRQPAAAAEEGSPATLEGAAEGSPPNTLSLRLFLLPLSVLLLPLRLRCLLAPEPLWSLELLSPLERPSSRKGGSLLALGEGRWLLLSLLQQYQ